MKLLSIFFVLFFVLIGSAFADVNINTASQTELESLQGIGPAKAKAIIEYREQNGLFNSKESLMDVEGIGQGTMKQLRDSITVGQMRDMQTTTAAVQ